ncbi:MAG: FixH family protein [Rhodocyclaceae bacterium]|nr:FixH family protein [Rhodocyclaceae bacterium]MCA3081606.1 FixH family protein [Rhodocyclaceae bacterium]
MPRKLTSAFSLLAMLSVAACAGPPSNLNVSLTQPTAEKKFVVELQPPATPAALNQMHAWQIKLTSPTGEPVSHALFKVDGGMPQHGHGLPSQPQVTKELAAGTYLLEGMKFSMTGWWEIRLAIATSMGSDKVAFNTVVHTPTAAR